MDTQRARALNPGIVKHWFQIVKKELVDKGFVPENIYGMDESGFPPSNQGRERVCGRRGTKTQHKSGNANRENVTVLVTICADGTVLRPSIIFKGKNFLAKWAENNCGSWSRFAVSDNGWTDRDIAVQWMKKDFDPMTCEKAGDERRALFMDGHDSHFSKELLEYAKSRNIEIFGYPPHCTHALQGLDVACFARMKECWKRRIDEFESDHRRGVNKEDFVGVFSQAFLEAFTKETVLAAFEKTGIWPFNADIISLSQMQPSLTTSTQGGFAIPQISPVREVIKWLDRNPEDESGASRSAASPSLFPRPYEDPCTPQRRQPSLLPEAGSSQIQSLYRSQQLSRVINSPTIEHLPPLELPDWSLLRTPMPNPTSPERLITRIIDLNDSLKRAKKQTD